jgi:hypothetical protein
MLPVPARELTKLLRKMIYIFLSPKNGNRLEHLAEIRDNVQQGKTLLEMKVLYHRKLFAEYVKAEVGNDVVQEVASTYVTVNMEGHLSLDPLPFCQYFISLQLAVPTLELQHFQMALSIFKSYIWKATII